MIELFCKQPDNIELKIDSGLTPIPIDESIISLSAILLNDAYYDFLVKGKRKVNGYSIIEMETVILLKIKAWLDMKERVQSGNHVDSRNLKKHKNDVFRLLSNVTPTSRVETVDEIREDILQFIKLIRDDQPDLKNLGIKDIKLDEMLEILEDLFPER